MQKVKMIIGASYGDEGKGLATDYFGAQALRRGAGTVTVLTNGGPQRGHTVELADGRRHVFKHFGSATFRGSQTYFGRYFLVNPMEFVREYQELEAVHAAPKALCDPQCRFTTPYDMLMNQMFAVKSGIHNTCGFGIWETVLRYRKRWGMSFAGFCARSYEDRKAYLRRVRDEYFGARLRECGIGKEEFGEELEIFYSEGLLRHYLEDVEVMRRLCPFAEEKILRSYENVLFENGQGLLLDGKRKGEKKFTTPSRTGAAGAVDIIERSLTGADVEVCYVSRSYLTRHGDGRMENELEEEKRAGILPGIIADATNSTNRFQGKLRYGQIADTAGLAERIAADFSECGSRRGNRYRPSVMITHLNEEKRINLDRLSEEIGTLYVSDGRMREDVVTAARQLSQEVLNA